MGCLVTQNLLRFPMIISTHCFVLEIPSLSAMILHSIQNVWYEKQISKTNNSLFQFNAGFSLWNQMISFAYFQLLKIHRCNYHDWNNLESKYCSKKKRKIGWFIINLVSSAKLFLCKINTLSKIKKVYPHRIIEGSVVFHF